MAQKICTELRGLYCLLLKHMLGPHVRAPCYVVGPPPFPPYPVTLHLSLRHFYTNLPVIVVRRSVGVKVQPNLCCILCSTVYL